MATGSDVVLVNIPKVQYLHINNIGEKINGKCSARFSFPLNDINCDRYNDAVHADIREVLGSYHKKLTDFLDRRTVYDTSRMKDHQQQYVDELIRQIDFFPDQLRTFNTRNWRVWDEEHRKYIQEVPEDEYKREPSITYYGCMEQLLVYNSITIQSYYTRIYSYKRNNRRTTEWVAKWKHLDERHLRHLIEEKVICYDKIYYF